MQAFIQSFNSPIGPLTVKSNGTAITEISLKKCDFESPDKITETAINELKAYFNGNLTEFTFKAEPSGTEFQKRVWKILSEIPYGETYSYGKIAEMLGGKRYSRAVGGAVHNNPVLIAIPCHRVICSDGTIGGFACGLTVKKYLLQIEGIL